MADVQTDDNLLASGHSAAFAGGAGASTPTPESSEDDDLLASGHSRAFAAPASPDITPPADARWSDVPHGIAAGLHRDVLAPLAQVTSSTAFTPELQQQYGDVATQQRKAGAESEAAMSPGGQQEAKTGSGIVGLSEQVAPTAAFAIPAMVPGVGPALGLGAGAILGAGGAESQVQGAIEQDPKYGSMTPDEKRQFGEKVISDTGTGWKSAVIQGTLGAAGGVELGGITSKLGLGAAEKAALTGTGRVQGAGTAIGRGFVEMGVTGGAQTGVTQHALAQAGEGEEPTIGDVAKAGMEQGLLGAVIGGPLGFLHGGAHKTPSVKAPNTEAVGGENVAVGGGVDVNRDSKRGSTVQTPATTASPITPDIQAALGADKELHPPPTPGVNQSTDPNSKLNQGATGTPPGQEAQPPQPPGGPPPAASPAPPEGTPSVPNRIGLTGEPGSGPGDLAPVRSPSVPDMSTPPAEEPRGPLIAGRDYGLSGQESFGDRFKAQVAAARAAQPDTSAVPEHPETLQLQQEALANGQKELVFYPKGVGYSDDIKDAHPNIQVAKWANGDRAAFRTDGDNNLTRESVKAAVKNNTLNKLLGLGDVSRDEAVARVEAGQKPVAVTEQTPAGREARTAAGTDQTAAAQAAAMEKTKLSPENQIVLKSPEEVIAARSPEQTVAGAAGTTPRVLEDVSPEGQAVREKFNKTVQERAAQVVERVQEAGHREEPKKQARLDNNATANAIFDKSSVGHAHDGLALDPSQQGGKGARARILARIKNALAQASEKNWEVPGAFRKNVDPEMNHSLGSVWLKEANTLFNRIKAGKAGDKDYARFLKREAMARQGDLEGILNDRINEAKEVKEPKAEVKEEAVGEATPGVSKAEILEHAEVDEEAAYQRAREAKEADRMAKLRAESEELKKSYPVADREAPKFERGKTVSDDVKAKIAAQAKEKLAKLKEDLAARKQKDLPTAAMITAGNYEKPQIRLEGENIRVETGEGELRPGWIKTMEAHYGYIRGTVAKDGEQIDALIGPEGETGKIYVLNQLAEDGSFDEHKVLVGFNSKNEALETYESQFPNDRNRWKRVGGVVSLDRDRFKEWLESGDKGQPISSGLEGEHLFNQLETYNMKGQRVTTTYSFRADVNKAIDSINLDHFPAQTRPMVRDLLSRFRKLAGDMPVYGMTQGEMAKLAGTVKGILSGFYDPVHNHITINMDTPANLNHILTHEIFHAVTIHALNNDPHLMELATQLHREVNFKITNKYSDIPGSLKYGLTSPKELMTEIISNPAWHEELKKLPISNTLARDLDMPRWRKATLFQGALDIFRKMLGYTPREYSYIEAALNLGEKAMYVKDPDAEYNYEVRASQVSAKDLYDDGPLEAMFHPTSYSKSANDATEYVKDRVKDITPAAHGAMAAIRNLIDTPRDWVERAKERNWGLKDSADNLINRMGLLGADRARIAKISTPMMDRLAKSFNETPEQFNKLAKLFVSSTVHGADARDDLGVGVNDHIKPHATNIENSNKDHWDAIKGSPADRREYNALDPDHQQLYNDTMDELSAMNKRTTEEARNSFVQKMQQELSGSSFAQDYKDALQKVMDRKALTPAEEAKFSDDDNIKDVRHYDTVAARAERGAYFPLQRTEGTHAITGEHTYAIPANGKRLSNDPDSPDYHRIVFDNRKAAFDFDPKLPTTTDTVHYQEDASGNRSYTEPDPVTGKEKPLTGETAVKTPGVTYGEEHHVIVNPRELRFANGMAEGERIRRQMIESGMDPDRVSAVQPRKNQEMWQFGVNSNHVGAIIKRLDKMDLTSNERANMTDAIKHVAAASMPGSRLSRGFLDRDRTGGAGSDIIQSLDKYRWASASMQAMSKHRNEIDKSFNEMKDYVDSHGSHKDAGAMRQMVNMFDDRINHFQKDSLSDMNVNKRWNFVRSYTTLMDLVSPAFFALHQLHMPLTVLPDAAARHGSVATGRVALGVYRDMGGKEVSTAFRAVGKALTSAWKYDHRPTDFIEALKNESNLKADEKGLIDWLIKRDIMHSTGIDFSQTYVDQSLMDKAASKSRNFAQEFIGSADAFNKVNSAIIYYRLAKEKGMSGVKAYQYAADGITRTQGQYSSFNKMGLFRDPRMASMLQYKQYPILMAKMIAKAMYNSFAPGVEWETRARALRTLGLMTLSAGAMSGVQGGTAYPIRMTDDLLHVMGLTDGWETHMDELRQHLAKEFGPTGATAIMDGVFSMGGIYAGHRGGISDPLGINYLLETAKSGNDMYKYIAGTPGGAAENLVSGIGSLAQGKPVDALEKLLPRVLTDPIKAFKEHNEGVSTQKGKIISPPVSLPQMVEKALGFTTIGETHAREARSAVGREAQEKQDARKNLTQLWQSGNKAKAMDALRSFNTTYPDSRVTVATLAKTPKPTILGYPETPRAAAKLKERAHAYGF